MGRRATILTGLAMVTLSSCGAPPAANPPAPLPVTQQSPPATSQPVQATGARTLDLDMLAEGSRSQLRQPGFQALRTARELASFVQQAGLADVDSDIDWQEQMVLAVYAGDRPGRLDIESLQIKDDMLIAKVTFEPDAAAAATATRGAYALVVVPKAVEDVDVRGLPAPLAANPSPAPTATPSPAAASPAPSAAPAATGQATVQIIAQGTASGVRQPVNVIIRTAEEWQAVWGTHAQGAQAQAQPNVDMTKQSVIGIFLGEQQGIGGIAIDSMQMTQAGTIQLAAHVVPAAAAQGTAKVTPYMLISMPKTAAPVEIQIQGAPQAPTLGNPQAAGAQPASAPQPQTGYGQPVGTARPGFGQPTTGATQPGFGQAVGGSQLGGMPGGVSLGGANAAPPFPARGSLLTGSGGGGLLGPGGYY